MVLPEDLVLDLSVFFKITSEKITEHNNIYLNVKCFEH